MSTACQTSFKARTSAYSFTIPDRDEGGFRALSQLQGRRINLVANALAQSTDHILSFFSILDAPIGAPESAWAIIELLQLDPTTRDIPVFVYSSSLDALAEKETWLRQHGVRTLPKPFRIDALYSAVVDALCDPE